MVGFERSLAEIVGPRKARRRLERGMPERVPSPISGGAETTKERIERLVAEGKMAREAVVRAEQTWRDRLQNGVRMPSAELVRISLEDVYHIIVDPRMLRKPERIELLLGNVFEIREAHGGRRCALARWQEESRILVGYAIILPDSALKTAHIVDEAELRRIQRKELLLWQR